jgi:hypothetical protein
MGATTPRHLRQSSVLILDRCEARYVRAIHQLDRLDDATLRDLRLWKSEFDRIAAIDAGLAKGTDDDNPRIAGREPRPNR